MKAVQENVREGAEWQNNLLEDLGFIKKHLRFRLSKKTMPSLFIIGSAMFVSARSVGLGIILFYKNTNPFLTVFFLGLVLAVIIIPIRRYWLTLKFSWIKTSFFADENMKLVERFLLSRQLMVYRHPKAPEVFQIASTPFGSVKRPQREIMIFIADDKRILINSHFINQWLVLSPPSGYSKRMATELKQWIDEQYPQSGSSAVMKG